MNEKPRERVYNANVGKRCPAKKRKPIQTDPVRDLKEGARASFFHAVILEKSECQENPNDPVATPDVQS